MMSGSSRYKESRIPYCRVISPFYLNPNYQAINCNKLLLDIYQTLIPWTLNYKNFAIIVQETGLLTQSPDDAS